MRSWVIDDLGNLVVVNRYITLWPWHLTLWTLVCHVIKLCTKLERNWRIRCTANQRFKFWSWPRLGFHTWYRPRWVMSISFFVWSPRSISHPNTINLERNQTYSTVELLRFKVENLGANRTPHWDSGFKIGGFHSLRRFCRPMQRHRHRLLSWF